MQNYPDSYHLAATGEELKKYDINCTELIKVLHKGKTFMIGDFKLKSGQKSPVYIDFRGLISTPSALKCSINVIWDKILQDNIEYDCICGVPYAALPLATGICLNNEIPMLMRRKESKDYGTKKLVEGVVMPGQKCLIIEDVVTEGSSILETVDILRSHGLVVNDAVVLMNREQGAQTKLAAAGISLHSVITLDSVLNYMVEVEEISVQKKKEIKERLADKLSYESYLPNEALCWSMEMRTNVALHPKAKRLLELIQKKRSNLCVAADLTVAEKVLELARKIGSYICILKIHSDIIKDFSDTFVKQLQELANQFDFLIFEDRKYSDIGSTVFNQFSNGLFKVADWADLVTVHSLPGPAIIDSFKRNCHNNTTGLVLVAEMSSEGNLCDEKYRRRTVEMAEQNKDIVLGFVCQKRCCHNPQFIYMTPGVHIGKNKDSLGQQYRSPKQAVVEDLCDIVIVGRGIFESSDPILEAKKYQKEANHALIHRSLPA